MSNKSISIVAVTVTYGDRWSLLERVILSAKDEGVDKVVVVSNKSKNNIQDLTRESFGEFCEVITLDKNYGSAGGFYIGLERASALNYSHILLLDDDNVLSGNSIVELKRGHNLACERRGNNNFILLAKRKGHLPNFSEVDEPENDFIGFDVVQQVKKFGLKRSPIKKPFQDSLRAVVSAPWSGMFFSKDILQIHGYPNRDMYLYADDTEFSIRIRLGGGVIYLVELAEIEDLEESWHVNSDANFFAKVIKAQSHFRTYYSFRNQAWLELNIKGKKIIPYVFNALIFYFILFLYSLKYRNIKQFKNIARAALNGWSGHLGEDKYFKLD